MLELEIALKTARAQKALRPLRYHNRNFTNLPVA